MILSKAPATNSSRAQISGKALTVAEVVFQIRSLIEQRFPAPIWIEGEISNSKYHSSGHIYFSLVDEKTTDRFGQRLVLRCAFFRSANQHLKFKLADGQKVFCLGRVTTYEANSQYQLLVTRVEPKGVGALQLAFEQLKKRLQAEGLFDESRKRSIPVMPDRVGIITSSTGSAVHDMVSKLRGYFDLVVVPVKVEGKGAALEIVQAISRANQLRLAQVLIVGRGGGSVEALWAFNEESVARAIAASGIPVISAIGHQDDWTIADYVSDMRASTPTDAAKFLVHDQEVFAERAHELIQRLVETMDLVLDERSQHLRELSSQLRLLHPLTQLERYASQARELQGHIVSGINHWLDSSDERLRGLAGRLEALSPLAVLARGYSITRAWPRKRILTSTRGLNRGDTLETLLGHGRIVSEVTDVAASTQIASDGTGT